jgi:anti-sigma B factor antagonist
MAVRYAIRDVGDISILDVMGQLTLGEMVPCSLGSGVVISDAIQELGQKKRKKVLMNLAGVTYVDSCGIGHLVRAIATARRVDVDLKLANAAAPVFALLRMTHLERIVDIENSEAAGLAAFEQASAKKK